MTLILRVTLLTAFATVLLPAVSVAQGGATDSLLRRIELLERRTEALEQLVSELEVLVKTQPSRALPVPPLPTAGDLQNWRRLRMGMNMNEVRALLGEPERVDAGPITHWRWRNANVYFMDGKVEGWSEPGR